MVMSDLLPCGCDDEIRQWPMGFCVGEIERRWPALLEFRRLRQTGRVIRPLTSYRESEGSVHQEEMEVHPTWWQWRDDRFKRPLQQKCRMNWPFQTDWRQRSSIWPCPHCTALGWGPFYLAGLCCLQLSYRVLGWNLLDCSQWYCQVWLCGWGCWDDSSLDWSLQHLPEHPSASQNVGFKGAWGGPCSTVRHDDIIPIKG